jgi:predicted Zn-dependent peptidase
MHTKHTFPNKLRLITKPLEGTKAVTIMVLVGAGSRYETKEINGIAHFLEHMFFKGAKKFKNTKEVSEAIDGIGGDFNAFTGKEYAGYYVKVAGTKIETGLDVLSDMLLHARFDENEIEKERGVILEELNMYKDAPMYQIGWDFEQTIFGDQPLGWDQIGTPELIKSVTKKQFQDFKDKLYTPDNTVITIVGDIKHQQAVKLVEKYFQFNDTQKAFNFKAFQNLKNKPQIKVTNKKTEQAHLYLGFPTIKSTDKRYWTQKVLSSILGGNMSSRMFLNVREAQGLCYYVNTSIDSYLDAGSFATRAGVDTTRIQDAIQAILKEFSNIKGETISPEELTKGKEYLKGKMILRLEESENYASLLAEEELLTNEIKDLKEIINEIDSVTSKDIEDFTNEFFKEENLHLTVIGPYQEADFHGKLKLN